MKILHVNTELNWRGGERQTLLTLSGLKRYGIWAGLVARPGSAIVEAAAEEKIPVFPLAMRGPMDLIAARRLSKIIRRKKVEIIHLQTSHAASIGLIARGLRKRPVIVASRRVDFPVRNAWKYNRFNAITAISNFVANVLIGRGVKEELIRIIPSGVPVAVQHPENIKQMRDEIGGESRFLIGTIGHLADHKGHRFLIEAMPRILEKIDDVKLLIIGDGELRNELKERATFFGVEDRVVFTGFRKDVQDLIWTLDLYVQPSVKEGLCTTLFDVMLRNIPIVASNTGGIPEALSRGKFGKLVPPGEPDRLAEAIGELLLDEGQRRTLTDGAKSWVERNFSADAMIEKTVDLYKDLLAR